MENGSLYTHIQNKIAVVEFFHPASNSLPGELLARLANAFNELSSNNAVNVIILKSEKETTFCAGASFDELSSISSAEEGNKFFLGLSGNLYSARTKSLRLDLGRRHTKLRLTCGSRSGANRKPLEPGHRSGPGQQELETRGA